MPLSASCGATSPNNPSLSNLKVFGQWTAVEGSTVVHSTALVAVVP